MANILTLAEALAAIKLDYDYDNEIADMLPSIDLEIEVATGRKWQDDASINPLAKAAAKLRLQIDTKRVDSQLDTDRYTYKIKMLQVLASELAYVEIHR